MNYLERWQHSKSHDLLIQVQMAMVKAAVAICNEPPSTPGHEARVRYAMSVLNNPEGCARSMSIGVAALTQNATVSVTERAEREVRLNDDGVDELVASLWNAYAGVNVLSA